MRTLYEAAETVENLFQDLARYHYVCTEGGRNLTPRWDREEYAARVGGGCPGSAGAAVKVVEHACLLHDLWFDGGMLRRTVLCWPGNIRKESD
jgi:hypothetical protein